MTPPGRGRPGGARLRPDPARRRAPAAQEDLGAESLEGRRAVREALAAGRRRVRTVWLATGMPPSPIVAEIRQLAERHGVAVRQLSPAELAGRARTGAAQGVLARADPLPPSSSDALLRDPGAFLVVLEGVTDPRNLGAVLRSAEASGATGVLLPRHRSAHLTPAAVKAAAGAVEHLPMALVPGIPAALLEARRGGVRTVGLDGSAKASLFDLDLDDAPLALVLGAEGKGLSRLAAQRCDDRVSIPMLGRVPSLNVAAAATLACYEVARRRGGA